MRLNIVYYVVMERTESTSAKPRRSVEIKVDRSEVLKMSKKLDLSKSVYELVNEYPELVGIMDELGFHEVTKKPVLNSVGKLMTIPKGAKMKKIPMIKVVTKLMTSGFTLTGEMPSFVKTGKNGAAPAPEDKEARIDMLKGYLKRLGEGEDLETVRSDFAENFAEVEAAEIMQAEQDLMKEGTPLSEVQKLCDLHSALFHGATREERIANAEIEVGESLKRQESAQIVKEKNERARELEATFGHPLSVFAKENNAIAVLLEAAQKRVREKNMNYDTLLQLHQIATHYAKKGDLLYPHLKARYGVTGPSEVMWTVDDEIRDTFRKLAKEKNRDDAWYEELGKNLTRAEEMIYKEQNILFPITAVYFTQEDWYGVYRGAKDYDEVLGTAQENWEEAEKANAGRNLSGAASGNAWAAGTAGTAANALPSGLPADGEIRMPGGHMNLAQLIALLNTIPMEISFIDDQNINRFFNEGPKVFKRPDMALDREVFSCHPPKIEPMVRGILDGFKDGSLDNVPVWMEKNGRETWVNYMAVRDRDGSYLGALEVVQDMEFAREHFEDKMKKII